MSLGLALFDFYLSIKIGSKLSFLIREDIGSNINILLSSSGRLKPLLLKDILLLKKELLKELLERKKASE